MTENVLSRLLTAHADAILGALSQPDIGQLFPDSDPKWKGQTSDVFVKEAVRSFPVAPHAKHSGCQVHCSPGAASAHKQGC